MKKSLIYTKKGDAGKTSLVDGARVGKDHDLVELYGEIDELNSYVGVSMASLSPKLESEKEILLWIQHRLFDLGSNLACAPEKRSTYKLAQITEKEIAKLENEMDRLDSELTPLKNFVLPGGHIGAAQLHICRTVCRRAERRAVHLLKEDAAIITSDYLRFLNRLSDYFFVLSRYVNKKENSEEVLWNPKV